jgi:NTP pyrophosphatase (non-canonical NTP hydrolase)
MEKKCLSITQAQELVREHLKLIDYFSIETTPEQAFLHLIEETGELARTILYLKTGRGKMKNQTAPQELNDELADIFWQTLKLAIYLDCDLESCFLKKLEKNRAKGRPEHLT